MDVVMYDPTAKMARSFLWAFDECIVENLFASVMW